ncbi:hypothetical protein CDD82_4066 [Ophiocordyceps australis]|uniref:Mpv17/PMP22 family protein n=1 Tax=Ophiocordyceps australis TaxID=1399860 RepID=A0A2C5ZA14_9HYPO|nr:hypothetical protein CDD82_4066 [Ophiocordyceps australis]
MPSPMAVATLQASGLSVASNLAAQVIEAHNTTRPLGLDVRQLLRFLILTLLTAPPNYLWQHLLERKLPAYPLAHPLGLPTSHAAIEMSVLEQGGATADGPASHVAPVFSWRNTVAKCFIDCITLGAFANTLAFLLIMGLLKAQPRALIWHNIATETLPIILAGYKIWPIASLISFTFVPVQRRIVWLSTIGFVWGIYMSLVASRV